MAFAARSVSSESGLDEAYSPAAGARFILAVSLVVWAGLLGAIFALV